jgi:glycerol-3-phosphate dehydrogenase
VRELRPYWMIRAGLLLYDHLAGRGSLPRSRGIDLHTDPSGKALAPALRKGFAYFDCWVQDARLVVLNAMDAAERGAAIWPRTRCVAATREGNGWRATLRSTLDGQEHEVRARALINAAGPWVAHLQDDGPEREIQLVKGSHIVVPRLFEHDCAYIFQHTDGRVVFAIPYERDFTLIGTTEVPYDGDPAHAEISSDEIDYLCTAVNRYLATPIRPEDIVATYAGVRPLHDEADNGDTSAISRDYALDLDTDGPALLTVLGGKLTTYRRLACEALDLLRPIVGGSERDWTGTTPLPGGDVDHGDFDAFLADVRSRWPWLPDSLAWRLARHYGTRMERIIGNARAIEQLGECLGADLYEAELHYLVKHEWAMTAEDVLWRRTKLGLRLGADERAAVERWIAERARRHSVLSA